MDYCLKRDALEQLRHQAWKRFCELRKESLFPNEQAPEPQEIPHSLIDPLRLPHCSQLLFVDGHLQEESSRLALPAPCVVLPLDLAMKSYGLILQNRLSREIKEEGEAGALLNGAWHGRGAFLYVPPGMGIDRPLQIISVSTSPLLSAPRIQLFLGKGSTLTLIQTTAGEGTTLDLLDVSLEAEASFHLMGDYRASSHTHHLRATLKKNAQWKSLFYSEGGSIQGRIVLSEEGAYAECRGLALLREQATMTTKLFVDHAAPHCRSRQHIKHVLHDASRSLFEGEIFVRPIAQKTEAYQLNQNLLLSQEALAKSKPNLEIFADDVKASHGATIAQLTEKELFYLQSRGIDPQSAKKLLLEGFCRELIDCIPVAELRARIQARAL